MEPVIQFDGVRVFHGDCRDVLATLPDNSVDSVVTDPPYELGFMGKKWDSSGIAYDLTVWRECLRVLKPGGHLLAFGGSRTWHRLAVAIEDAGLELRDSIAWLYASGFPKSLDVSKAIDKRAGAEREVIATGYAYGMSKGQEAAGYRPADYESKQLSNDAITPEAQQWQGWGTALKPAFEPVVVARKPLVGTVAENVLRWGVGGLNIDGSRIGSETRTFDSKGIPPGGDFVGQPWNPEPNPVTVQGRWPANVILDEVTARLLDEQSGQIRLTEGMKKLGDFDFKPGEKTKSSKFVQGKVTMGGASRFFYVAKASKRDRNEGLNLCRCDKLDAWENEDHKAQRQAATDQSTEKAIGESGTLNKNDSEWNTSSSGNKHTVPSKTGGKSTTKMATNSTIASTTLSLLIQSPTSDSTAGVNSERANGGNRAKSVANISQSASSTGISAEKAGPNMADADPATSKSLSSQNSVGAHQCSKCFGIIGGHPTVKPTALMRYLVKLVTPPGGTVLDPFTGSGSTGKAAILEGFEFVGVELTGDYLPIIEGRLRWALDNREDGTLF